MIENKLINLNSNYAQQLNSTFLSSLYFSFPALIVNKTNIKKISVNILNAQLPYSFYIINIYNNVLRMDVNGGVPFSITLTRGNYNSNTLISEILTQLATLGITTISCVLSNITGCLTFTTTGTSFTFYSSGSTILQVLGFSPTSNYTSSLKILVAPFPLNLLNTLKIRICSTALISNTLDSSVKGTLNILASFAVNSESYGLNLYENQTNIQNELIIRDLNGFDIQILDDFGNLINFNNVYWTATMLITTEYEDIIENYPLNPYYIPTQDFWGANPDNVDLGQNKEVDNIQVPINETDNTEMQPEQITDYVNDENDLTLLLRNKGIFI